MHVFLFGKRGEVERESGRKGVSEQDRESVCERERRGEREKTERVRE